MGTGTMGRNTIKNVIIGLAVAALLGLGAVMPAAAQGPAGTPTPNFEMPYEFGMIEYDKTSDISGSIGLKNRIKSIDFFNMLFAYILTTWDMLISDHSGTLGSGNNIIALATIVFLGVRMVTWVASKFVFKKGTPIGPTEMSDEDIANASFDGIEYMTKSESSAWSRFGTYLNKRGKYY